MTYKGMTVTEAAARIARKQLDIWEITDVEFRMAVMAEIANTRSNTDAAWGSRWSR